MGEVEGHERKYTYDEVSNLVQFENPLENLTKWAYDKRDQVEKATDPLNNDFYYTYDELGRLTKEKDPLNREFNYNYNSLSQLIGVTDPNNNTTSYNYDNNYNLTKRIRPATSTTPLQEINYTFDELDRLTKVTSPLGFETQFNYNVLSMLTSITYPDSSTSSFSYDNLNRLNQINSSDNYSVSFSYDNLDRLTTLTDSINGSSSFTYDTLSRVTDETDPSNYSTSYSYDADSRLTEKEDDSGTTSFIYDAASRLTQITAPGNLNYSIGWDAGDRVNSESLPNNVTINSLYDANDRPIDIIYTLTQPETFPLYFKDPESKESSSKSSSYPKNLPSLTILSTLTLFYYLENGRLKDQIEKDGGFTEESYDYYVKINNDFKRNLLSSQQIVSFSYNYNPVSQLTAENIDIGGNIKDYIYAYDNYDQLNLAQTPDGTYSYTFDERNNRLTQRIVKDDSDITEYYIYDLEDRLTNLKARDTQSQELIKEINYLYDNNGNLINKTIFTGGGAQTYNYSYYVGGNLKSVILPDESQIQFTYYAGGLRANKTTEDEIITYHYSGGTLSKEVHKDKVTGEVIKTIRYIPYGIKIEQGGNTQTYFYVTDMRGSVIALTDEDGYIVETYSYNPFGNLLSTPTIYNPKLFIGRDDVLYDPEISLYYMHARYYDPEAGRFIMKDPVEGNLGNPITQNSYIYCANDPVNKIDPAGTTPQNTGLPPRNENEPQAVKWAGSNRTAFCTPTDPVNDSGNPGIIYTPQPENLGNDVWLKGDAMDTFDSCGGGKLISWKVYNRYGQIIAEDKGDGDGPIFYEIDEDGNLIDKNGKTIDPNDKDYESKRIESKDISKTLKYIEVLASYGKSPLGTNWVSGEAWDSEGNRTNVIIAYKQSTGNWRGFTIENIEGDPKKPDTPLTVRGFYEENNDRKIKQIEDIFKEIGVEFGFDVPSGSFLVMEVIDMKIKREGKEIESFTYTIKEPILYRKIGCGLRPKYKMYHAYILKWNIDLITPHMLFWRNKLLN